MTPPWALARFTLSTVLPNSTFNECITQCGRSVISIGAIGERALGVRSGGGCQRWDSPSHTSPSACITYM